MATFLESETFIQLREWLGAARDWGVDQIGSPRSWLRKEPLPSRPLILIAAVVAAGVCAARVFGMAGWSTVIVVAWWCAATIMVGAWGRLLWLGRSRAAGATLLLAVACTAAAWSAARWSLFSADDLAWWLTESPTPVAVEAIVVEPFRTRTEGSPSPRLAGPELPPMSECVVAVCSVRHEISWRTCSGRAVVHVSGRPPQVGPGDRVQIFGRGLRPTSALNPGEPDAREQARAARCLSIIRVRDADSVRIVTAAPCSDPAVLVSRIRSEARSVLDACIAPARAGLAAALLIGGRETLSRDDSQLFVVTGTIHILSISGLHVGILAYAICRMLRLLPIRRPWMVAAAVAITGCYAVFVGAETPAIRATVVVWLACLAAGVGRRAQGMTALAAAAVVVLAWQPAELFRTGAQLSFLSTAVLVVVADILAHRDERDDPIARLIDKSRSPLERRLRRMGTEAKHLFVAGAAVWLVTAPIVASRFHVVSPVAILINPLIAPLVAIAMGAGFLCLALAPVSSTLAVVCGWTCDVTLAGMVAVVEAAAGLPGGFMWVTGPQDWWLAGWYAALAAAMLMLSRDRLRQPIAWAAVAACWIVVGAAGSAIVAACDSRPPGLRAVIASMGHGCGIVVRSPAGRCLVYDAGRLGAPGAGRRAMAGVLRAEGVRRIDTLVISHADADHFNAVPELIEWFSVGEIVVSEAFVHRDSASVGELLLLARQARIPVRTVAAGDSFAIDPLCRVRVLHPQKRVRVLHPQKRVRVLHPHQEDGGHSWGRHADNETSIVMAVEAAGRRLLFTGDLEGAALRRFVAADPDSCDVLVAPHHGSITSLPADIAKATAADWVLVSGDGGRRWGDVERAYSTARGEARPATVLKTGGTGAIGLDLAASKMTVAQFSRGAWRAVSPQSPP